MVEPLEYHLLDATYASLGVITPTSSKALDVVTEVAILPELLHVFLSCSKRQGKDHSIVVSLKKSISL
jgi:hypothetical protein